VGPVYPIKKINKKYLGSLISLQGSVGVYEVEWWYLKIPLHVLIYAHPALTKANHEVRYNLFSGSTPSHCKIHGGHTKHTFGLHTVYWWATSTFYTRRETKKYKVSNKNKYLQYNLFRKWYKHFIKVVKSKTEL